jgi:hypothetical protein
MTEATNMTMSEPLEDPTPEVDLLEEQITVTPEEIIDAFEAVYEELVMLRNSVINLHERLEKVETPSNASV